MLTIDKIENSIYLLFIILILANPALGVDFNSEKAELGISPIMLNKNTATKGSNRIFHLGIDLGIPFFFGINLESFLTRDDDQMPSLLLKTEVGLTFGPYASAILEKRMGHSHFYAGLGYNYTHFIFAVPYAEDSFLVHSILFSLTARSSYKKGISYHVSLGGLITRTDEFDSRTDEDEIVVIPTLKLGVIFGD